MIQFEMIHILSLEMVYKHQNEMWISGCTSLSDMQIFYSGSTYIPKSYYTEYLSDLLRLRTYKLEYWSSRNPRRLEMLCQEWTMVSSAREE